MFKLILKKGNDNMLALQGYYDGETIKTSEKIQARKNQKVIITILDEFIEDEAINNKKSSKGALSQYSNPNLQKEEKTAWEKAVKQKYDNA